MNRIDRLFAILLLLQLKRRLTAHDLATRFGITERTVYRDMKALSAMGVPLVSQAGVGYELLDTFSLPPLALKETEATAVHIALEWFLKNSVGQVQEDAASALQKIQAILPDHLRQAIHDDLAPIAYYPSDAPLDLNQPLFATLKQAIQHLQLLQIEYQNYHSLEPIQRRIEPMHLTYSQGAWYVEAFCRLQHDLRSFRLSRIQSATLVGETFVPRIILPPTPTPKIDVWIQFAPHVVAQVRERQHYAYVCDEDGVMCYRVTNLREIQQWVLGFGADAHVQQPLALRVWLREEAQRLIQLLT
jgi:predicted DNA-binding transcriptional regulator YafY